MIKTAFVFPGQGSQSVGMLAELAASYSIVRETFEEASDSLHYNVWKLTQEGPESDLNQTDKTQPAMLAASMAVARVWRSQGGPEASVCAGHSLGEYSALVYSGALNYIDGVYLVSKRGRHMQQASPVGEGAMAAILGLQESQIHEICAQTAQDQVASAANYNAPGQIVVAGHAQAVQRVVDAAKKAGARRAVILPVSVPSHCELMRPAEMHLRSDLEDVEIRMPNIPVIHNSDVAVQPDVAAIRRALSEQLHSPVRWVETIRKIASESIQVIVECGPGKVLSGLNKRIEKNLQTLNAFDARSLENALNAILEAI